MRLLLALLLASHSVAALASARPLAQDAAVPERQDPTVSARVIHGERAVLIQTDAGFLRRIELPGADRPGLEISAETADHVGVGGVLFRQLHSSRVVTGDASGSFHLRRVDSLDSIASTELGPDLGPITIGHSGRYVAGVRDRSQLVIGRPGGGPAKPSIVDVGAEIRDLAIDFGENRLAALSDHALHVVDLRDDGDHRLQGAIPLAGGMTGTKVTWTDEGLIAVGLHDDSFPAAPAPHVQLVHPRAEIDTLQVGAPASLAPLGGIISSLEFDEFDNVLTYGITSAGSVVAVDGTTLEFRWGMGFGGGNPGGIGVHHPPGSPWCFSYGMTERHRAVINWATGEDYGRDLLVGFNSLDAPIEDDLFIAIQAGSLVVLDRETLEVRARRTERGTTSAIARVVECVALEGTQAALVRTESGLVRRVEIEGMRATAETRDHLGAETVWLRQVEGGQVVTADDRGRVVLRSSETLEAVAEVEFEAPLRKLEVSRSGKLVAGLNGPDRCALKRFDDGAAAATRLHVEGSIVDLSFDENDEGLILLGETWVQPVAFGAAPDELLDAFMELDPARTATRIEPIGDGLVAIGGHRRSEFTTHASVHVIELSSGVTAAEFDMPERYARFGGVVSSLSYDAPSGLLTYGIASAGCAVAVDPRAGETRWAFGLGGGIADDFDVYRPKASRWCFTRAGSPSRGTIAEWESGRVRRYSLRDHGSFDATEGDRFIISVMDGALHAIDPETSRVVARRVEPAAPIGKGR